MSFVFSELHQGVAAVEEVFTWPATLAQPLGNLVGCLGIGLNGA
jgi:hypothetical protein